MYQQGVFYSQPVHFGHWAKMYWLGFFLLPAGAFWPFWAKVYWLGIFQSQPVHFGHFGRKCTWWDFFCRYILVILAENVPAGNFSISAGTFWPFWAKMYRLGIFLLPAGAFWPFWTKRYQLGFFYSQPVCSGHFWRQCTGLGFFILSRYILVIWGWYILVIMAENVPAGGFFFSAGTFWPFWAKMCRLAASVLRAEGRTQWQR